MTRIGSLLTLAALGLAAPLAGQGSKNAEASANLVILRPLTLAWVQDLEFGTWFASDGDVFAFQPAAWRGETDPSSQVSVAFTTLPAQLTRVGGTDFVELSYGNTSGALSEGGSIVTFDPKTGGVDGYVIGASSFEVTLGASLGNGVNDLVKATMTGKPAGTYTATIVVTVMVQ